MIATAAGIRKFIQEWKKSAEEQHAEMQGAVGYVVMPLYVRATCRHCLEEL